MKISDAVASFAALSQETRLKATQLLVRCEPEGLPAGEIAGRLCVPHNTMSAHLAVLARAGWVTSRREGRSIIYRVDLEHIKRTIWFLMKDCCNGHPEVCTPLLASLNQCIPEGKTKNELDHTLTRHRS